MLAEIITIGDEILIGQIVDTNSAWIAQQLNIIGIRVKQISSVYDDKQHILTALSEASKRADIILITGGLGPTKDDITKKTLAEYFGVGLVENKEALANVSLALGEIVIPGPGNARDGRVVEQLREFIGFGADRESHFNRHSHVIAGHNRFVDGSGSGEHRAKIRTGDGNVDGLVARVEIDEERRQL